MHEKKPKPNQSKIKLNWMRYIEKEYNTPAKLAGPILTNCLSTNLLKLKHFRELKQ